MREIQGKVYLHNFFEFEVKDAETNEIKQTAKAYNMVMNNLPARLAQGGGDFYDSYSLW
jgi:hypothetical protein